MVFRVDTGGRVFSDLGYTTPAADVAELLPAQDGLEPGDVLVVGADGILARSSEAYQPSVVGVYSTKPSLLGGVQGDDFVDGAVQPGKVPLAILGVVPTKVSVGKRAGHAGRFADARRPAGACHALYGSRSRALAAHWAKRWKRSPMVQA